MDSKKIFYVSGLPRAGSTVLLNILAQNPKHHCTSTSGLIELVMSVQTTWKNKIEFQSQGLEKAKPFVRDAIGGMIPGFFKQQLAEGKYCFDKSRGWVQYIEDIEEVLGHKIKVLCPVRDVRDILVSFEKLYAERGMDWNYPVDVAAYAQAQTIIGRSELLLAPGSVLGIAINRVLDASRRIGERIHLIPYEWFTNNPEDALKQIHEMLGLESFTYNFDKIEQKTHEDDLWHGMKLHRVGPKMVPRKTGSWKGVLPDDYAKQLGEKYKPVNILSETE